MEGTSRQAFFVPSSTKLLLKRQLFLRFFCAFRAARRALLCSRQNPAFSLRRRREKRRGPHWTAPFLIQWLSGELFLHFDGVRDDARLVRLLLGLLGIGDDLLGKVAVGGQARAGGDELTDDDVLLQADEVVDLALDGSLG